MKYVILIHANPQPWGHPTGDYLPENLALPEEVRATLSKNFEETLAELKRNGELVVAEALADPASASVYRWQDGAPVASSGPYSETKEHFAGFFLIDVESPERAQEVVTAFSGPGQTVELRPAMWG